MLLHEHLETDYLPMSQANDGTVELKRAHNLHLNSQYIGSSML